MGKRCRYAFTLLLWPPCVPCFNWTIRRAYFDPISTLLDPIFAVFPAFWAGKKCVLVIDSKKLKRRWLTVLDLRHFRTRWSKCILHNGFMAYGKIPNGLSPKYKDMFNINNRLSPPVIITPDICSRISPTLPHLRVQARQTLPSLLQGVPRQTNLSRTPKMCILNFLIV